MNHTRVVSVVLGSYNRLDFLKLTLESIRKELVELPHEIIVVDGGSTDGTLRWLMEQKDVITIVQHNRGTWRGEKIQRRSWGYFMNLGFKAANGTYVCMLSDDCLVVPGAIRNGCALFDDRRKNRESIGAVAFYWRNWPDQKEYVVGLTLGKKMFVNHGLYLKEALEQVGYIDEETYAFYHADGDLCLKMWEKGLAVIDSPDSYIEHFGHANIKVKADNLTKQKQDWENYTKRWDSLFYHKETKETGGWITREYNDPFSTANQFKKVKRFDLLIHGLKRSIRERLKKNTGSRRER
ncbi:glycosyltransferase [Candidatus Peregrinibacteria bacterium]|nr:glycosyltransferase [Candidatus Peregrinibacteria bacterium]